MKNFLRYTILGATFCALSAMPNEFNPVSLTTTAFAQEAAQDQPLTEEELALYTKFNTVRKTDRRAALGIGKEFLQKTGTKDNEFTKYVRTKVTEYEKLFAKEDRDKRYADAIAAKNYAEVFAAGKAILVEEPDNLEVMSKMADNGFYAARDHRIKAIKTPNPLNADTIKYSQMVIDRVKNDIGNDKAKAETFAYMNYYIAYTNFWLMEGKERDAAPFYYDAMQTKLPRFTASTETYYGIGYYYQELYNAAQKEYLDKFGKIKEDTDEMKAARANLNGIAERAADAYARAVRVARADTKATPAQKKPLEDALTEFYKIRNKQNVSKINEYVSATATKAMPDPRTPIEPIADAVPVKPTTATTPVTTTGTPTGTTTTGATTKPVVKPAAKPAPKKNPKK